MIQKPFQKRIDAPFLAVFLLLALSAAAIGAPEPDFVEREGTLSSPAKSATETLDARTEAVLKEVDRSARRTRTFCADYLKCEYGRRDEIESESRGRFYLERTRVADDDEKVEYRMRFEYYAPKAAVTIIDGATLHHIRQDERSGRSIMVDNRKLEVIFAGFMSLSALRENYVITLCRETPTEISVNLTPESALARKLFQSVRLTFDKATFCTKSIYQERVDGTKNLFILRRPKINATFSSAVFDPELMGQFVRKHRVKPPAAIVQTNIVKRVVTNDVPARVVDRIMTAKGEKIETNWTFRTEIKSFTETNIVVSPVKLKDTSTLPL